MINDSSDLISLVTRGKGGRAIMYLCWVQPALIVWRAHNGASNIKISIIVTQCWSLDNACCAVHRIWNGYYTYLTYLRCYGSGADGIFELACAMRSVFSQRNKALVVICYDSPNCAFPFHWCSSTSVSTSTTTYQFIESKSRRYIWRVQGASNLIQVTYNKEMRKKNMDHWKPSSILQFKICLRLRLSPASREES